MERKYTGLRIVLTAAIAAEFVASCAPRRISAVDATPTALEKNPTATHVSPTRLPEISDYIATNEALTATPVPTPTETAIPTPTVEQRFVMGNFDAATTPFSLKAGLDQDTKLRVVSGNWELTADVPLPIKVNTFGTEEQRKIFEAAVNNPFGGNPYFVITSDQENHLFFYSHSITLSSFGDLARKVTSFLIANPEQESQVLGKTVTFAPAGMEEIQAEIVHVDVMDAGDYVSAFGYYPDGANIYFERTDLLGIPEEIRTDKTPGVYYFTIVSCQSDDGRISLYYSENIKNRALLTLKVHLPQK
jgi:hypothetical protein